jgi:hypothetical protein
MSKTEALHELYEICKTINFDEADKIVTETQNAEERQFLRTVTDCVLQQKQMKVIAEKRF